MFIRVHPWFQTALSSAQIDVCNRSGHTFVRGGFPAWRQAGAASPQKNMYSEAVLDHFQYPRNAGTLDAATTVVSVENPVCGDILELSVRMEAGRVVEARFRTRGCVTAVACSSLLTELLRGKSPTEARAITPEQLSETLGGLPPATFHAAQLARDAVRALLTKIQ